MIDAQKLLDKAFLKYKTKYPREKTSDIAKKIGLSYSTIYNPLFLRRKCSADIWLKLMTHFGAIEVKGMSVKVK